MRIVSGRHKGRILVSPEGLRTRPTSDRARQAVFNILMHAPWTGGDILSDAHIMDVFAGTGAMGLEALSRGGADAVFIEQDRAALSALRDNLKNTGEEKSATVLAANALAPAARPVTIAPRTLVFLDPPYDKNMGGAALVELKKKGWLADRTIIVMEMAKKAPEPLPAGFTLQDERHYGVALVRFLTRG